MANKNVYSVKELNSYIKNMFCSDFMLNSISIKGEVSNCKYHNSGHIYFTLKDDKAAVSCVMFQGNRVNLKFRLKDGMSVIATGSVEVFERDGKYQLYARTIESDGFGALFEKYEALKKELEEQGMFDASYKRPIPSFIRTLGIVTSPTGAAIEDIVTVSQRRNPYVQLVLYPAKVQGEGAGETIIRGIKALCERGVDVIIVGRGGGSIEDLWAFNEREVAEAIFESEVPIISAVGHETDFTIADFVADLRAPTPSAAAELAVYLYSDFVSELDGRRALLKRTMDLKIRERRRILESKTEVVKRLSPLGKIRRERTDLLRYSERFSYLMGKRLFQNKHRLEMISQKLKALSPAERISGGYGMITAPDGKAVKSISDLKMGDELSIYIRDGKIGAKITSLESIENL